MRNGIEDGINLHDANFPCIYLILFFDKNISGKLLS